MARMRDRIFAGFGAFLFFASTAITIYAIMTSNNGTDTTAKTDTNTCVASSNEQTLPVPEVYKPTTPVTELEITDIEVGTGAAAKANDCLVMKYYGTLATTGEKFDENFTTPNAFAFKLGTGAVIEGWDKGLVGMKEGGTRRLAIPATQAYGAQSPSAAIPANSDLVFVVKLIRIQK